MTMCSRPRICHLEGQLHNIYVEQGINYGAWVVSHSSGLQEVIQSVNNHSTTSIPHTDAPAALVLIPPFPSMYREIGGLRTNDIWVEALQAEVDIEGFRLTLPRAT